MTRVVLLHGNGGGSGRDNWFPWLCKELRRLGVTCQAPDMPDPVGANASIWLPYLEDMLHADRDTVLVGHSSGAIAAQRYAETHELLGSVLVGTYHTDLGYADERASGYFDAPWNWQAIREHQQWIEIFASSDDPYIDISEPRFIRDHTGASYHEFHDQGHFGEDVGKTEFPELLVALKARLGLR